MIDEIYKLYEEEKNGKPEAGDVLLAMKVFEKAAEGFNLTANQRDDLWASVCEYSRAVEREAFKGGFHMAWKILQELQEGSGKNVPPHEPRSGRAGTRGMARGTG